MVCVCVWWTVCGVCGVRVCTMDCVCVCVVRVYDVLCVRGVCVYVYDGLLASNT